MKLTFLWHMAVVFFCLPSLASADETTDLKAMQGTWILEHATLSGRDHLEDFIKLELKIEKDRYSVDVGENADTGTISLGEKDGQKWITLQSDAKKGPFAGRTMPGLYQLADNRLTVCLNSEKNERPKTLEAPEKTPLMLMTLQRPKAK